MKEQELHMQSSLDSGKTEPDHQFKNQSNGQSGWDMVNHPEHYANQGGVECIDAIKSMLTKEEYIGYLRGNALKYIWRRSKGNYKQDIEKAQFYQNKLKDEI